MVGTSSGQSMNGAPVLRSISTVQKAFSRKVASFDFKVASFDF
jgi:hypothetical protein